LGKVPYGLPELFRKEIREAAVVANPGCFPTTAILALAPLVAAGLIDPEDIVVDSKTGVSGGGRTPKLNFHFPECNESVAAYGVGTHRHWPEINQIVGRATGRAIAAVFTPHLIPMDRGILSTIYVRPSVGVNAQSALETLRMAYRQEPFVRVTSELPATKDVSGTNYCDLTVRELGNRLVIVSVIDNLIKGAAGAAVQNLNVMCGYPETLGLL
jgi:N-acetyl-gamma-glutamyl-phosphate reductase